LKKVAVFLFFTVVFSFSLSIDAQKNDVGANYKKNAPGSPYRRKLKDSAQAEFMVAANFSFDAPGGALAKNFGLNSTIGASVWYKTGTNWLFGLEYSYIFGSQIKNQGHLLDSILTPDGNLIGGNGLYEVMNINERGNLIFFKVGKIFHKLGPNVNSGLYFNLGAGFFEHRILYYFSGGGSPPIPLNDDYVKGYDQLTYGPGLSQAFGFLYLGNNHKINFSIELEANEGITHNARGYDYNTMSYQNQQDLDMLFGIKVHWYLPFHRDFESVYFYN